ncbi:MAG: hypothetical protein ACYCST_20435 [Acidimicrobiales bacterium]
MLSSTFLRRVALAGALGLVCALAGAPVALAHGPLRGAQGASLRSRDAHGSGGVSSHGDLQAGGQAAATLESCGVGGANETGKATFAAQMEALPGTVQMEMRFEIIARAVGEAGFRRPPGAGPAARGAWRRSGVNVGVFKDSDAVTGLLARVQYRARVHFRWLDAEGRAVARAVHDAESCRQASASSSSGPSS